MPSIRIGLSTDFNLTNEQVGINTTVPSVRLDVRGQILSQNTAGGSGISTLTTYDGFLDAQQRVTSNISIAQTTKGNLNSLSGEIILDEEVTVTGDTPLTGGRLDSLTVTGAFDLPHGGTASRETTPEKGSTRFNQDLGQLEFYTGTEWRTTASYDGSGRGRGLLGNGQGGTIIDYIQISTLGNAQRFGDLTVNRGTIASGSNSTRGLFAGGAATPVDSNVIDYFTLSSTGNAIDFGDLTRITARGAASGTCSSSTRALFAGGYTTTPANDSTNVIDYVQISTIGNALDFGDLSNDSGRGVALHATCSSPTRGIFAGGYVQPAVRSSEITFLTISSTGNSSYFGDLIQQRYSIGGGSNSTRGIFVGGFSPSTNIIEYITISSSGSAIKFGDLSVGSATLPGVVTNSIRAVIGTGNGNTIQYITISTSGNAIDFGDLTTSRFVYSACSDSHGGLGGF
jgi:hypothetical protein